MTNPQTPGLQGSFWGSVNRWECDENDHLNVRFYAQKMNQALQVFLHQRNLLPAASPDVALQRIRVQHIRFLREARIATPLRIDCGIVRARTAELDVLQMMVDNITGTTLATFLTTVDTEGWGVSRTEEVEVPGEAAPRGLDPATSYRVPGSRREAAALGFHTVGRGIIGRDECDASGWLLPHNYIGRMSDGMPNLWAFLNGEPDGTARPNGELGGAALEYRLRLHYPLHEGSVFCHLSGIRSLGNKTQTMTHVVIDETTGRCAATADAVGVAMDLTTRRAVPISEERRRRLESLLIK
jgi:acyl-CoA thioester hydrolase